MRKTVWIMAVLLVGLAIGGYVFFRGERKPPVRYRTAPVVRGELISAVTATGTVNPVVAVQVGSQVSGMITSLHADFNSVVKAGDVVARIDPAPFKARRDQAVANLESAKANLAKAKTDRAQRKRELERAKMLVGQNFVSQNDVDVAQTAYEGAAAQIELTEALVKQSEAALSAAELDLKYTVIRSPVNGIVIARNVEVGQTVAASFATPNLFVIALDLTQMQVDTNVSESDIGGIREGNAAVFTVDAYPGERFRGRVRQVRNAPIMVQNVVTYNVVVEVDNRDLRLKPGMTANVSIIVAQKDRTLKVPNAAIRFTPPRSEQGEGASTVSAVHRPDGGAAVARAPGSPGDGTASPSKTVWVLSAAGDPEPVLIQVGLSDGTFTELTGGSLREGDAVIVGIDIPRNPHRQENLPPGFGTGGRRPRGGGL